MPDPTRESGRRVRGTGTWPEWRAEGGMASACHLTVPHAGEVRLMCRGSLTALDAMFKHVAARGHPRDGDSLLVRY